MIIQNQKVNLDLQQKAVQKRYGQKSDNLSVQKIQTAIHLKNALTINASVEKTVIVIYEGGIKNGNNKRFYWI